MKNLLKQQILVLNIITGSFLLTIIWVTYFHYSQSCGIDFYEEGKTVDVETLIYPGILQSYPEYLTS